MQERAWANRSFAALEADANRSADTHLLRLPISGCNELHLYLKDESIHPSGSLKHRLARSLFLYGLSNNWIRQDRPVIDASSGNTAIAEAYFAQLLGLPYWAVAPESTSPSKLAEIRALGGSIHLVSDPTQIYAEAADLRARLDGCYLDQFTFAERATDWRGNNNIAESIFRQLAQEPLPVPNWIVCGAGTGGTSATIGRYVRYRRLATQVCVVDPERSVFFDAYQQGDRSLINHGCSRVEGIGRPRVEASFLFDVVDRMIQVPDAASFAACHLLEELTGRRFGGSSGTSLCGALSLLAQLHQRGQAGAVVMLLCDRGERYADTIYSPQWLQDEGLQLAPFSDQLAGAIKHGRWSKLPELFQHYSRPKWAGVGNHC